MATNTDNHNAHVMVYHLDTMRRCLARGDLMGFQLLTRLYYFLYN